MKHDAFNVSQRNTKQTIIEKYEYKSPDTKTSYIQREQLSSE